MYTKVRRIARATFLSAVFLPIVSAIKNAGAPWELSELGDSTTDVRVWVAVGAFFCYLASEDESPISNQHRKWKRVANTLLTATSATALLTLGFHVNWLDGTGKSLFFGICMIAGGVLTADLSLLLNAYVKSAIRNHDRAKA